MKRLWIAVVISAGLASGQTDASPAGAGLVEEIRQIRVLLQQQQKILIALEVFRVRAQRIIMLEARLDQLETELASERRRLLELTTATSAAPADDRPALNEQYRRTNEAITELESSKSRCKTALAAETSQQDDLLKAVSAPAR